MVNYRATKKARQHFLSSIPDKFPRRAAFVKSALRQIDKSGRPLSTAKKLIRDALGKAGGKKQRHRPKLSDVHELRIQLFDRNTGYPSCPVARFINKLERDMLEGTISDEEWRVRSAMAKQIKQKAAININPREWEWLLGGMDTDTWLRRGKKAEYVLPACLYIADPTAIPHKKSVKPGPRLFEADTQFD